MNLFTPETRARDIQKKIKLLKRKINQRRKEFTRDKLRRSPKIRRTTRQLNLRLNSEPMDSNHHIRAIRRKTVIIKS
jgi:hypothetical protein